MHIFIQENAFENVVWKMPFCLGLNVFRPKCVKLHYADDGIVYSSGVSMTLGLT